MENEAAPAALFLPLGEKELPTFLIEDNADGSYRDFTAALLHRGWVSEKKKSKFEKRR
jgi:hypothetical protein